MFVMVWLHSYPASLYSLQSICLPGTTLHSYQAILTCGAASERNFPIKSGHANTYNYFLATTTKHVNCFRDKMASYDTFVSYKAPAPFLLASS